MRFLKTKIFLANQALKKQNIEKEAPLSLSLAHLSEDPTEASSTNEISSPPVSQIEEVDVSPSSSKATRNNSLKGDRRPTKNIVVNYGKAITSFALSKLAVPYLKPILEEEKIKLSEFNQFAKKAREKVTGIEGFRSVVKIENGKDGARSASFKRVLVKIGEIFIKYFSVNWIMHGRLTHKLTYLQYRFKVLRRIQNPELFTYMSNEKRRI